MILFFDITANFALLWLFKRSNRMPFIRHFGFKNPVAIGAFEGDFVS
jgi:hypothetical protein